MALEVLARINEIMDQFSERVGDWVLDLIDQSIKFSFDKNLVTDEMIQTAMEAHTAGLLSPPAMLTWAEYDPIITEITVVPGAKFQHNIGSTTKKMAVLIADDERGLTMFPFALQTNGKLGYVAGACVLGVDQRLNLLDFPPGAMTQMVDEKLHDLFEHAAYDLVNVTAAFLVALNCKDVDKTSHGPTARMARRRAERGLPPLISYTTLHIKAGVRSHYESAHTATDRTRPRFHFRRGHVRTLQTGRKVLVSPSYVGSFSDGVVVKDYDVRS